MATTGNTDARGAGPDETAKIMRYGEVIRAEMKQATEYRIQRGTWMRK